MTQEQLDRPLAVKSICKSDQDPTIYRVDAIINLKADQPAESLYETLTLMSKVAYGWYLFGPDKREDGCWQFLGRTNESQIKGVFVRVCNAFQAPIGSSWMPEQQS